MSDNLWRDIVIDHSHPPIPTAEPGRALMFITFGVGYAVEEHPAGDWVDPHGYLVVDYADTKPYADANGDEFSTYERARRTVWNWLGGRYSWDHTPASFEDSAHYYPAGEIKRMVLP